MVLAAAWGGVGGGAVVAGVIVWALAWVWGRVLGWVRFEVEEDVGLEVQRCPCRAGGLPGVLPGCLGRLCGGWGVPGSLACGRSLGFGCDFLDEVGGEVGVGG